MFIIEEIDPETYRKKSRNATFIIMGLFIVIGMIFATLSVNILGPYNNNHLVLNFLGAFIGLILTFLIVKVFFIHKPWMKEAMYAWRLKRNLMQIYNVLEKIKTKVKQKDTEAIKILRFYHLGLTQMNQLENNSHAQIELVSEKNQHQLMMEEMGIDTDQRSFDISCLNVYKTK